MKKIILVLLTFVPILAGWLVNTAIFVPIIGMLLYYVLPIAVLAFWFWLGNQFSKTDWSILPSILIGSGTGILSLVLYVWQFLLQSDENRNLTLAGISQMYAASVPNYLFGGIARLFEPQPNVVGEATMLALQVISVILMLVVFSVGRVWGRKHPSPTATPAPDRGEG